tara:strand:+ start:6232 stop:7728 length:1497 start_codon:yes stop_codon:yes gene_type:complete
MYGKVLLIIFIILFLLYLWNNITEMLSDENKITFILQNNIFHDNIFFKVATILREKEQTELDGQLTDNNGIPILNVLKKSKIRPILYSNSGEEIPNDEPYFTYDDNNFSLDIKKVAYVSSGSDIFPYYCKNKETNFDESSYTTLPNNPLFISRLAILIKVNEEMRFNSDYNIDDLLSKTLLIKLKHVSNDSYKIMLLEDKSKSDLNNYLIDDAEKTIMYIYEGIDIGEDFSFDTDIYKQIMNMNCSDIMRSFGERHNHTMSAVSLLENTAPTWTYNKLFDHIHEYISEENTQKSDKYFNIFISNNIFKRSDPEYEILDESMYKKHIISMKYNMIFFHYHLKEFSRDDFLLNYITLDITDLKHPHDNLKDLSLEQIRELFLSILDGSKNKHDTEIHNYEISLDNLQQMIYIISLGEKKYIRLPYFLHMCSDGSDLVGILTQFIIEKRKDNKYYINFTDVCRYNNDSQRFIESYNLDLQNYGSTQTKDNEDSNITLTNKL